MSRMDKYTIEDDENETLEEEVVLSRVNRNQVMYDDVYFNRTKVDIDNIVDEKVDNQEQPAEEQEEVYEKKSYSVNEYLEKAHENKSPDNYRRDIDDTAFREQEDEIRKLIASINEKEESEDFFKDLKGGDGDTTIGAKFKTDEFNDSIYETLKSENVIDEHSILNKALSDKTVTDMEKEEDEKVDHTFEKIVLEDEEIQKKKSIVPIVVFCIVLFTLMVVVAIILLVK